MVGNRGMTALFVSGYLTLLMAAPAWGLVLTPKQKETHAYMQKVAGDLNRRVPLQLMPGQTLIGAEVDGVTFVQNYRLEPEVLRLNIEELGTVSLSDKEVAQRMGKSLLSTICNAVRTPDFLSHGGYLRLIYTDKTGSELATLNYDPATCK